MAASRIEYRKEFFDRDYTVREAYWRVWKYARRYKFRLFIGVICGMLTAGTLIPFFQIVQPALQHVESHDAVIALAENGFAGPEEMETKEKVEKKAYKGNAFEREIEKKSKLPGWYPKVKKLALKVGISLENDQGGMGGALVVMVCVIVPFVAFVRLVMMFLPQLGGGSCGERSSEGDA